MRTETIIQLTDTLYKIGAKLEDCTKLKRLLFEEQTPLEKDRRV